MNIAHTPTFPTIGAERRIGIALSGAATRPFGSAAARLGRTLWNGLAAIGAARGRNELMHLAALHAERQSELADRLRSVVARRRA